MESVSFAEDLEVCKGGQVQVFVILLFYACCAIMWQPKKLKKISICTHKLLQQCRLPACSDRKTAELLLIPNGQSLFHQGLQVISGTLPALTFSSTVLSGLCGLNPPVSVLPFNFPMQKARYSVFQENPLPKNLQTTWGF